MNPLLKQFYDNKAMAREVKQLLSETADNLALSLLKEGKTVGAEGAAQASKVVDMAFSKLREEFEPIKSNIKKIRK